MTEEVKTISDAALDRFMDLLGPEICDALKNKSMLIEARHKVNCDSIERIFNVMQVVVKNNEKITKLLLTRIEELATDLETLKRNLL